MTMRHPDGERIVAARKAAAKELGKPATDPLCKQFAPLLLAHELVQVRVATGNDARSIETLLRLDAAMTSIRELAGVGKGVEQATHHTVEFKLVEPRDGAIPTMPCRRCGWRHGDDFAPLPPPQPEPVDVTPASPVVADAIVTDEIKHPDRIPPAPKPLADQPAAEGKSVCHVMFGQKHSDRWTS